MPAATRADPTLQHLLGLLHRARSDLAPAIAAFDRALAARPYDARLVHARARAAAEAGLDADEWFVRARALALSDGDVILSQAGAWALTGRGSQADALLCDTLATHPGWLGGHWGLLQMRFAAGDPRWLAALDDAIVTAPGDARLHAMKVWALHRAGQGDACRSALGGALTLCGDAPELRGLAALVASEHGTREEADAAFARIDPLAAADTTMTWLRHLLRRGEPDRVAALESRLGGAARNAAWPYLSLAWRLTGDPRAAWLDDPRLVQTVDMPFAPDELEALGDVLRALHVARSRPLDQSVRGGTQTEGPLLSRIDPVVVRLRDHLRTAVHAYVAALPAPDPAHPLLGRVPREPRFQGSWSVRLASGGHHDPHVHGEGWLSSACYVALPGVGAEAGALTLGAPQPSLGVELPPLATVTPAVAKLVLFPSTLWHGTLPFAAGERLTVAFDIA